MVDKELVHVLKAVGFNDKEARGYLALLELGKATATEVARRAELKRSIMYYTLRHLEKRGFVHQEAEGKVQHFSASDPSRVLTNAHAATEELRFMLPLMRSLFNRGSDKPKIEYFEGKEATLTFYRTFYHKEDLRFLTSIHHLQKFIPEEVESWVTRYKKKGYRGSKTFLADTEDDHRWAKKIAGTEEIRILPPHFKLDMDFTIAEGILCITSFEPLFTVAIHSLPIADSAAQLFDLAWLSGTEVS